MRAGARPPEGAALIATTRRRFLGGALASAALPTAAAPRTASATVRAEAVTVHRGRALAVDPAGARLVVAHDQRRTISAGSRVIDVGGQPVAVAIAPDGRRAAVATAFWDAPGIALVDLDAGALIRRVEAGPAPYDVAWAGDRLVVSGGEQEGTVHLLDADGARIAARPLGTLPRGIATDPGGESAWIALAGVNRIAEVGLADGRVRRTLATPPLPERVALAPDGSRLLVSHTGLRADAVSELRVASGAVERRPAGRLPSAVAWTEGGAPLVALGGAGAILDLTSGARHPAGAAPRGLATAGRRAWTVDALTGAITEVSL